MATILQGTCSELLNLSFARLAAAADLKAAAGTPATRVMTVPGYTANYAIPYCSDGNLNRTFDILDAVILSGVGGNNPIRFTSDDAQNFNLRNILSTLASGGIIVPTA